MANVAHAKTSQEMSPLDEIDWLMLTARVTFTGLDIANIHNSLCKTMKFLYKKVILETLRAIQSFKSLYITKGFLPVSRNEEICK